jgi:hypothetical protein
MKLEQSQLYKNQLLTFFLFIYLNIQKEPGIAKLSLKNI